MLVDDVQAYLEAEGITDGSTSWPSVRRRLHDGSDQLVVITEDGGPTPEIGAPGVRSASLKDPAFQVRVRATAWDGDASAAKAQEIFDALHGRLKLEMGEGRYLRVAAQSPEPVFIGYDERGRPEHTISFRAASLVTA